MKTYILSVPPTMFKQIQDAYFDCWSIEHGRMDEAKLEQAVRTIVGDAVPLKDVLTNSNLRLHLNPDLTEPVLWYREAGRLVRRPALHAA